MLLQGFVEVLTNDVEGLGGGGAPLKRRTSFGKHDDFEKAEGHPQYTNFFCKLCEDFDGSAPPPHYGSIFFRNTDSDFDGSKCTP